MNFEPTNRHILVKPIEEEERRIKFFNYASR
jgi:hypothetical protein